MKTKKEETSFTLTLNLKGRKNPVEIPLEDILAAMNIKRKPESISLSMKTDRGSLTASAFASNDSGGISVKNNTYKFCFTELPIPDKHDTYVTRLYTGTQYPDMDFPIISYPYGRRNMLDKSRRVLFYDPELSIAVESNDYYKGDAYKDHVIEKTVTEEQLESYNIAKSIQADHNKKG